LGSREAEIFSSLLSGIILKKLHLKTLPRKLAKNANFFYLNKNYFYSKTEKSITLFNVIDVVIELAVDIEPAGMCFKMQLFYNIPRSRELKISAVNLACCIKRDPPPV